MVGCPRSGTTVLKNRLDKHPNLCFPFESHFIPNMYLAYGDPSNDAEAWSIASKILSTFWITNWHIELSPEEFTGVRTYRAIVEKIFFAWSRQSGIERVCDKTPHNVIHLPTIVEIFPDAKIVHIYRDGRDVALSWLFTRFEPRNMYTAAKMWNQMVRKGRLDGSRLPPSSYMELSYEEFSAEGSTKLNEVLEFIGEDPNLLETTESVGLAEKMESMVKRVTMSHERMRKNAYRPLMRDNTEKWKQKMSEGDQALFEGVAGDLLTELGYPVRGVGRKVGKIERWFWTAHHQMLYIATRISRRGFIARTKTFLIAKKASMKAQRS